MRLCFNRKNKTLGAIFRTKSVLKLIAENLRTQRALAGGMAEPPTSAPANPFAAALKPASSMDVEVDEDEDDGGAAGLKEEASAARVLVDQVLEATSFAEQRASKMDLDDFTLLLAKFNEVGIHFMGSMGD